MAGFVTYIFSKVPPRKYFKYLLLLIVLGSLRGQSNRPSATSTLIECDQPIVYLDNNQTAVARGNAKLVNQDILLYADQLVWRGAESIAEANRSVIMNYGETRLLADFMVVNFETGEYWAENVRALFSNWVIEAREVKRNDLEINATEVILHPGEPSSMKLNLMFNSLSYGENNKTFAGQSITPRFGRMPVGFFPYLRGTFKDRAFINPSARIGNSDRLGWYLGYSLKQDDTSSPLALQSEIIGYQKRGVLLSPSLKHRQISEELFSDHSLSGGWIHDQDERGEDLRNLAIGKHRGYAQLRSLYEKNNFRLATHLDWETDSDFRRDFKQKSFQQSQWSQSFTEMTYHGSSYILSVIAKGQLPFYQAQVEFLPQLTIETGPLNYHGVYHSIYASLSRLVRKNEFGQNTNSLDKIDLGYRAMKPFTIHPGVYFNPSLSIRNQNFQASLGKSRKLIGEWANDLSFDFVGDFGYKNKSWDINGLTHNSKISFSHRQVQVLNTKNQAKIPEIFEFMDEVNLSPIDLLEIREDRYLQNYDLLRLGWENELYTNNRQLLKADFYHDYRKVSSESTERLPFFSKLEWFIAPWVSLALKSNIDTRSGQNLMRSASIGLVDGRFNRLKLSYSSFLDWNDFITLQVESLITEQLTASGTLWYDADKKDLNLWAINLSYSDLSGVDYFIQLSERSGTRKEDEIEVSAGVNLFSF